MKIIHLSIGADSNVCVVCHSYFSKLDLRFNDILWENTHYFNDEYLQDRDLVRCDTPLAKIMMVQNE